jgi:2-polyprenyl-3-methyl-5-hydroxy-6-metoxy-1,4-benzoquinol methylase
LTHKNTTEKGAETQSLQWTSELVRKFWNYQSRFPENYFTSLYGDEIAKAVRKYAPRQARILDYACGTGALIGHLLRANFSVGGSDLSPDSVAYVRKVHGDHPSFKGAYTLDELLAGTEKFDVVVLAEIIEHVDDDALVRVMSDVRRVLLPGGVAIITTPNDENLDGDSVYCPCCNHTFHRWQHVRSWSVRTLAERLFSYGFQVVVTDETDFSLTRNNGVARYYMHRFLRALLRRKQPHLMVVAQSVSA